MGWGGRTVDLCHLFILHIDSSLSPDTDGINVPRVRHSFHLWFDSFRTICCSFVLSDLFFKRPPEGRPARHLPDATNPVRRLNEEWSARAKAKRLGGSLPRPWIWSWPSVVGGNIQPLCLLAGCFRYLLTVRMVKFSGGSGDPVAVSAFRTDVNTASLWRGTSCLLQTRLATKERPGLTLTKDSPGGRRGFHFERTAYRDSSCVIVVCDFVSVHV